MIGKEVAQVHQTDLHLHFESGVLPPTVESSPEEKGGGESYSDLSDKEQDAGVNKRESETSQVPGPEDRSVYPLQDQQRETHDPDSESPLRPETPRKVLQRSPVQGLLQ